VALTLPQGAEKGRVVEAMFDRIAPRYDLVNGLISLGAHHRWKRAAVRALGVAPGARTLDLACGTGDLLGELGAIGARGLGLDRSGGMLAAARRRGVRVPLLRAAGEALPLRTAALDGAVCGFALRNFVDIAPVLREVARVLRPGARLAIVEVDRPRSPFVAGAHRVWFERVVPVVGGLLSDGWAYRYLPTSAAYLPDDAELRELLEAAGFDRLWKRRFMFGAAQLVVATRKAAAC
jgi:demethylmenaquinone methyltransferase/2-methoxy-6-polyprenyl-1,4-benzoquinol methylase